VLAWDTLTVLCLGGAGQAGKEICRQLAGKGTGRIVVHDLTFERAERAVAELRDQSPDGTVLVASAGDLFEPARLNGWEFQESTGPFARVCRETRAHGDKGGADRLESLLDARLGAFTPDVVRDSLIWNLVDAYRPHVVVDTVNTATVLGYASDIIQSGRTITAQAHRILAKLREDGAPPIDDLEDRIAQQSAELGPELAALVNTALHMTANLDSACMIRFVQCLYALFDKTTETAVPEFQRYVKVHTTGLGGMGFNVRFTHGDTGEPGLSTKLLGKVSATGQLTQLLLTLAHTPGCDVRVVVPATVVGWTEPKDEVIEAKGGALPLVDSREPVPCDGTVMLRDAIAHAEGRVADTGGVLEVPYLSSGENKPYAVEDIRAITALGQMGSITKEEVAHAAIRCIEGETRHDIVTAIDTSLLMPTESASLERDRMLKRPRESRRPSVSLGNLGPTTAKLLYEIEILRSCFETVERLVHEGDEMKMTLKACSYIMDDGEGAHLRRQILSLGIPIFMRRGPGEAGLLLGRRLLSQVPGDVRLDPSDVAFREWLQKSWIDLTGPRMRWWRERFVEVLDALQGEHSVSRNSFDPGEAFTAGQFLAYLYSISGGERKELA